MLMYCSETLSPKGHGKVSFDKKGYHYAVIVSFTETPPVIAKATHIGGGLSSPSLSKRKGFAPNLRSSFGVTNRNNSGCWNETVGPES